MSRANREHHISSIGIRGFRGIETIENKVIDALKGINIFVGRNNSGKSTIIEALYLVSTLDRLDVLGRIPLEYIVKRRGWYGLDTIKDLIHRKHGKALIEATIGNTRVVVIMTKPETSLMTVNIAKGGITTSYKIGFKNNGTVTIYTGSKESRSNTMFIDWNIVRKYGFPEKIYSFLIEYGGKEAENRLLNIFKTMYSDLEEFKVLPKDNKWVLTAVLTKYSIPFYLLGDGARSAFIYIALLSSVERGIILAEEPEIHQHLGSMEFIAEALVKSYIDHGNQVFITTHSLELIDLILRKAKKYHVGDEISIYRVSLKNGKLKYRFYSYEEALKARVELELDLRV